MSKGRSGRSAITVAALVGFLAGAITMAVVLLSFSSALRWPAVNSQPPAEPRTTTERKGVPPINDVGNRGVPPTASAAPPSPPVVESLPAAAAAPTIGPDPVSELRESEARSPGARCGEERVA